MTSHKPTTKSNLDFDMVAFRCLFWELWCLVVSAIVASIVGALGFFASPSE